MPEPTQLKAVPNAVQRATGPSPQQMQHTINVLNGVLEVTKRQRGDALDVCAQLNVDVSMLRGEIQRLNEVINQAALAKAEADKEKENALAPGSPAPAAGTDSVADSAKPEKARTVEPDPPSANAE